MAHARLIPAALALGALISSAAACGGGGVPVQQADLAPLARGDGRGLPRGWGMRRAPRAHLAIPLPDAASWSLDDRSGDVVAEHPPTSGRLVVKQTTEHEIVGRVQCEARAREAGLVPASARTVESADLAGPGEYDTHVWVAVEPGAESGAPMTGWVFAFGGHLKRCLFVRYETRVPSAREEAALSSRLAAVRERLVPAIAFEAVLDPVIPRAPRAR